MALRNKLKGISRTLLFLVLIMTAKAAKIETDIEIVI